MSAPYLEEIGSAIRAGARDLHAIAERVGIDFESCCLSFNNGLLKGYWKIELTDPESFDVAGADTGLPIG